MSVLIYTPAIILERIFHLKAEIFVILQTMITCLLCIEFSTRLIARSGLNMKSGIFRIATAFVIIVLPMGAFGQKDHLAFVASLPLLLIIASADRRQFTCSDQLVAGLFGGLTMAIKPQFALVFILPCLAMFFQRRRISDLHSPAFIAAGALVVIYAVIICLLFPSFTSKMLPVLTEIYRPVHENRLLLLLPNYFGGYILLVLIVAVWPLGRKVLQPLPLVLLLAGIGFFLAFMEQAKGWPYQAYPALASGLLLGLSVTLPVFNREVGPSRSAFFIWLGSFAVLFAWAARFLVWSWIDYTPIEKAVFDLELKQPSILSIAASHGPGHPVTRDVNGKWAGTLSSRWITVGALKQKKLGNLSDERNRSLDNWVSLDRAYLRHDILEKKPDVILVQRSSDFDWLAWAQEDPSIAAAFAHYQRTSSVANPEDPGTIEIWRRLPNGS
ncbi:hypothetical protein CXZ10_09045 [Pleomorphomonas diazotrophica]|uniref:Glycosyltransferase RgtA/B/C/D-like domain-containing protein n=2 Tax=Pleomorphomonas diazotrophica TaxID=1166257 RepID=A0A2N3LXZ4_9HYPH|nr:hypothetical protein CXZ10_09045 [Pleomorphomonas diazotrophica]